jgi:hypothetical protein
VDNKTSRFNKLQLRRRSDQLIYHFVRVQRQDGSLAYLRTDKELWLEYEAGLGWIARDPLTKELTGRPWNKSRAEDQDIEHPPEGEWVSKKGSKSYVYDLVFTGQEDA